MTEHVVVQMPEDAPGQLFLLFHGVGGRPENLVPLGQRLAREFPSAAVVSVAAPDAGDLGSGRQWFSVQGVTEDNRPGRIAATMPRFVETVRGWQRETGAGPARTALIGFSQGAIMALESTQPAAGGGTEALAGRVVSLSGRFAGLPVAVPVETTLHFIHGGRDAVIDPAHAVTAAEHLLSLGADLTADVLPQLGHAVDTQVEDLVLKRLQTHVPKRIWEAALREAG